MSSRHWKPFKVGKGGGPQTCKEARAGGMGNSGLPQGVNVQERGEVFFRRLGQGLCTTKASPAAVLDVRETVLAHFLQEVMSGREAYWLNPQSPSRYLIRTEHTVFSGHVLYVGRCGHVFQVRNLVGSR